MPNPHSNHYDLAALAREEMIARGFTPDFSPEALRQVAALRAHRLAREDKVVRNLAKLTEASLDALIPVVYDDVPADRHQWARLTLQAHLIKLAQQGRVSELNGVWRLRP